MKIYVKMWYGKAIHADSVEFHYPAPGRLKGVMVTHRLGTVYLPKHCIKKIYIEGADE